MQTDREIRRVRDGLVSELWDTVATEGNTEHTELLARIDTLNWVLSAPDEPETRTVEGPAMTLASLIAEDPDPVNPDDDPPIAARSTLADTDAPPGPPSMWETLAAKVKRGTDVVIHSTGHMTPTEILNLRNLQEEDTESPDVAAARRSIRTIYRQPAIEGGE